MNVLDEILKELEQKRVEFEHFNHERVHTSEDAAKIRGNSLSQAAKAIVLKVKEDKSYFFIQAVLQGSRKIDLKALRKHLGVKSIGLASPEEVLDITGCTIGSVPPFGHLFGLDVYIDKNLELEQVIFFSAGSHYDSIKISSSDYFNVISPRLLDFSLPKDAS
jgi:Ala-tRNA(Pro) deacylase